MPYSDLTKKSADYHRRLFDWTRRGERIQKQLLRALSEHLDLPAPGRTGAASEPIDHTSKFKPCMTPKIEPDLNAEHQQIGDYSNSTFVTQDGEWRFCLGLLLEEEPQRFPKMRLSSNVHTSIRKHSRHEDFWLGQNSTDRLKRGSRIF